MLEQAIAIYLAANVDGLSFEADTWDGNVFLGHMPSSPHRAVMLMPTGGPATLNGGGTHGYDDQTLQVMTRGESHDSLGPQADAAAIYDVLQGLHNISLTTGPDGPDLYVVNTLALQQRATSLGQDENERYRYSQNYSFHVRNQTTHRN